MAHTSGSPNAEVGTAATLSVVAYGVTGRRTTERLRRAGLPVVTVEPEALTAPVTKTLYLAPADCAEASVVQSATSLGAHVCLMPPWPHAPGVLLGGHTTIIPAQDRSGVRIAPALAQANGDVSSSRALRILYREQLAGVLGQALAETAIGEPLLAAMPRTSNRHGQVLASTLLVGTPSAQTELGDVAILLRAVIEWLARVPVDRVPAGHLDEGSTEQDDGRDEQRAQIALLALAMTLPAAVNAEDDILAVDETDLTAIQTAFDSLSLRLGQSAADDAFARGWRILRGLDIVSAASGAVRPAALRDYLVRWQLTARLRRLRQHRGGNAVTLR